MSTFVFVFSLFAAAALLAWWMSREHRRLVRHRDEMVEAFGMLHDQLTRRHRQVQALVIRAAEVAAGDASVRVVSMASALDAARTVAHFAKAQPADGARIAVVDRAEVALTYRLSRFMSSLVKSQACREDDTLRRQRHEIVRTAVDLHVATQCFNQAALAYNRVAREAVPGIVAKAYRFSDAMVVSPVLANLLLAAHRRRRRAEAAAATPAIDTGEDTRFGDDAALAYLDVELR